MKLTGNVTRTVDMTRAVAGTVVLVLMVAASAGAQNSAIENSGPVDCAEWIKENAGWYGARYQGRPTASGQPFDRNKPTAAHRTLSLGSEITVKNPESDATVTVRITDRGPFVGERTIDLSQAAAEAIGILGARNAPVKLCIDDAGRDATLLQVSSFSRESSARTSRDRLRDEGYSARVIHEADLYRVIVEVSPRRSLDEARSELEAMGFPGAFPYRGAR